MFGNGSTTAYGNHDFKFVSVLQRRIGVTAFRYDLAIELNRDALPRQPALLQQGRYRGDFSQGFQRAVDDDIHLQILLQQAPAG